jgi:molybdopterin synthase sulfur carrier subunit
MRMVESRRSRLPSDLFRSVGRLGDSRATEVLRQAVPTYIEIMNKPLTILYFAWLRERVGASQEELVLPESVTTVADLVDHLCARSAAHTSAFQNRRTIRCAVNQEFADPSSPVRPGDEVAFFPPVTGG